MKLSTNNMVPLINTYKEYKDFKFHNNLKTFKRDHPWIKIKAPRMPKDRQTPPHPKTNWIEKTKKNILRIDVQYPHQEENNHFICWKKFRKELKKKLNNQDLDIHIWIVDKNDHINVPKNLE